MVIDMISIFPYEQLRKFIEQYISDHGFPPKILVANPMDLIDWKLSNTFSKAKCLLDIAPDLKITYGDYLERGQVDVALAIKDENGSN